MGTEDKPSTILGQTKNFGSCRTRIEDLTLCRTRDLPVLLLFRAQRRNVSGKPRRFMDRLSHVPIPNSVLRLFCLSKSGLIGTDIICAIIVIASCSAGSFVLYKIYNKTLKIRDFNKTIDELFDLFERDKGYYDFDVPEKYAFNEFAINAHLSYLLSIKDTVRTRQVLKRYINFISLLLYALIFLPINFE